jgi:hypothetical protein
MPGVSGPVKVFPSVEKSSSNLKNLQSMKNTARGQRAVSFLRALCASQEDFRRILLELGQSQEGSAEIVEALPKKALVAGMQLQAGHFRRTS